MGRFILTISYHILFIFFFFNGVSVLLRNVKNKNNQLYFFLCLSFAIWSEALGIANANTSSETAVLWRRFASIGWGTSFIILFHFVLNFSGYAQKLNRIKTIIMYIPAMINIFLFGLYSPIANNEFVLVETNLGWINTQMFTPFDMYYRIYYLTFVFATISIMFIMYRRSKNKEFRKTVQLNTIVFISLLALTNIVDFFIKKTFGVPVPALEPFYLLIALLTFKLFLKKHGKNTLEVSTQKIKEKDILTKSLRKNFYKDIGFIFYLTSFFTFFTLIKSYSNLPQVMLSSTFFILLGTLTHHMPKMRMPVRVQDILLVLLMCGSILQLLFRGDKIEYLQNFLWAIPIIYMTITSVFEIKLLSFLILVVAIIFELNIMTRFPIHTIDITVVDHIGRISFYLTAYILNNYVRKVFVKRKNDLESANDELLLSEQIINQTSDGVCITDLDRNIIKINDSFCEFTGYSKDELIGKNIREISLYNDYKTFYVKVWNEFLKNNTWKGEVWFPRKNGTQFPVWLSINIIRNTQGKATNFIGLFSDISELRRTEEKVKQLAYYDSLTGLPNRFFCKEILKKALVEVKRNKVELVLMFLDLDGFKMVNDTLGHSKGDEVLIEAAKRIKGVIKSTDTVSRLGGDEFIILLENFDRNTNPNLVAKRILRELSKSYQIDDVELFLGASIGIVIAPDDSTEVEDLLMKADSAMYNAKELGKNRYCFYSKEIQDKNIAAIQMESKIKKGLINNDFLLHIQPKIKFQSGTKLMQGGEALIRMKDGNGNLIPPFEFIKVAENSGLIIPLGRWVISEACKMAANLNKIGLPTSLAVNVSVKQFEDENFVSDIIFAVENNGIAPWQLELEITESIFKNNIKKITEKLEKIKSYGVKISIDDFGTGYSSLNLLGTLPIDCLKIDKTFTDKLGKTDEKEFVSTIINMASSLNLSAVVEGVETAEQLDILSQNEEITIQGFFFSKPLSLNDFIDYTSEFK